MRSLRLAYLPGTPSCPSFRRSSRFASCLYRNPNGEIRVDLFVPQGVATVTYDTQSVPATTKTCVFERMAKVTLG